MVLRRRSQVRRDGKRSCCVNTWRSKQIFGRLCQHTQQFMDVVQMAASITFSPGQTVRTYTFTWSGALPADHTYPGPGGVQVTSPNQLTSQLVAPTGTCS